MNQAEFAKLIIAGTKKFDHREFRELDTNNFDAEPVNGLEFTNCSFEHCKFATTVFENCTFTNCNFFDVSWTGCRLTAAKFETCTFTNCDWLSSTFHFSQFVSCSMYQPKIDLTNFYGVRFPGTRIRSVRSFSMVYISEDCGIIVGGFDMRGYLFLAIEGEDRFKDYPTIIAGCRTFGGFPDAVAHWTNAHRSQDEKVLHANCLGLIRMMRKMAKHKGWPIDIGLPHI